MNNRIYTLVLFLFILFSGTAQTKEDAMSDAKTASKSALNEDYNTAIKYMIPQAVNLMGGDEKAKNTLAQMFSSMKSQGFAIEKSEVLEVSDVVTEQNQYRCIVKSYNQMVINGQRMKSTNYLVGIYNPEVKHWQFIEAKQLQYPEMAEQIIPDFKTDLEIPKDDVGFEPVKN